MMQSNTALYGRTSFTRGDVYYLMLYQSLERSWSSSSEFSMGWKFRGHLLSVSWMLIVHHRVQGQLLSLPPQQLCHCTETLAKHYQNRKKDISRTKCVTHLVLQLTQHQSPDEADKELSARQMTWFLPIWNSSIAWWFCLPAIGWWPWDQHLETWAQGSAGHAELPGARFRPSRLRLRSLTVSEELGASPRARTPAGVQHWPTWDWHFITILREFLTSGEFRYSQD